MDNELEAAWDRLFAFCESRGAETKRIGGKFRLFFPDTGLTIHVERIYGTEVVGGKSKLEHIVGWPIITFGTPAGVNAQFRCDSLRDVSALVELFSRAYSDTAVG